MKRVLYSLFVILLVCSCNDSHKKVIEKNKDGSVFEKWVDETGKEDGVAFLYFPNSASVKRMMFFDRGAVTGNVIEYYKSGKVKYVFNFNDGKLNGHFYGFYESQKMKEVAIYKLDTIQYRKLYNPTGYLIEVYKKSNIIPQSEFVNIGDTFQALINDDIPGNYNGFSSEDLEFYLISSNNEKIEKKNAIGFIEDRSSNKMKLMFIPQDKGLNFFAGKLVFYDTLAKRKFVHQFSGSIICK
ncbi:MAG: hypothetical protein V4643_15050 [Bacteroidota bacterium]